jgi:hypothetical protein
MALNKVGTIRRWIAKNKKPKRNQKRWSWMEIMVLHSMKFSFALNQNVKF